MGGNNNFYDGDLSSKLSFNIKSTNGYNYAGFKSEKVDELIKGNLQNI